MPKTDITKEVEVRIVGMGSSYYLELRHKEKYIGCSLGDGTVYFPPSKYEFQGKHFGDFRIFKKE